MENLFGPSNNITVYNAISFGKTSIRKLILKTGLMEKVVRNSIQELASLGLIDFDSQKEIVSKRKVAQPV